LGYDKESKFYVERLKENSKRTCIEQVIKNIVGQELFIETEIMHVGDTNIIQKPKEPHLTLGNIAQMLNAKIINEK
jgi:hypothetical protein